MKLIDPVEIARLERIEAGSRAAETANLTNPHACPVCGAEMQRIESAGHPARFCAEHNLVNPEIPE